MASFWEDLDEGLWEDEEEMEDFPEEEIEEDLYDEGMDIAMEEDEDVPRRRTSQYESFSGSSFTDDIVQKESGGNYKATNPNSSAAGKYQFLWNTWGDKIKQVTGIESKQDFLNNPEAQDAFYESYYVPNEMLPAVNRIKQKTGTDMSDEQLAKLYHFRGEKGAIDYLSGRLSDKPEKYNSSISSYIRQFGGTTYEEWKNKLPQNLKNTDTTYYDLKGAYEAGLMPEKFEDGYHLGSRNPKTGLLLKKKGHPTFDKMIEGETKAGYEVYKKDGKLYSKLKKNQFGGQSYRPEYNPLAPGQQLLGENLQLDNLYPTPEEENSTFDFGFVQNLPDIYGDVSSFLKRKASDIGSAISGGIDIANDYLSDVETMNRQQQMNKLLNKPRMINSRMINNNPIYT